MFTDCGLHSHRSFTSCPVFALVLFNSSFLPICHRFFTLKPRETHRHKQQDFFYWSCLKCNQYNQSQTVWQHLYRSSFCRFKHQDKHASIFVLFFLRDCFELVISLTHKQIYMQLCLLYLILELFISCILFFACTPKKLKQNKASEVC